MWMNSQEKIASSKSNEFSYFGGKIGGVDFMKIYNKLVRDKIPEIINADNKTAVTRELDYAEYLKELNIKLQEEVKEYLEDYNVEELADIVEVIYGILNAKKVSNTEFEQIRNSKVEKRGAFNKKIFLEKVIEDGE